MNACNPKTHTISGFDAMQADLAAQRDPTTLLLAPIGGKTVELDCDGGRLSSDAGLILLKDIDDQLGLTRALAAVLAHDSQVIGAGITTVLDAICVGDYRDSGKRRRILAD